MTDQVAGDEREVRCGVCGRGLTHDFFEPPTFTDIPIGTTTDGKVIMKPVLSKPIRMDPETGAVCWCPQR